MSRQLGQTGQDGLIRAKFDGIPRETHNTRTYRFATIQNVTDRGQTTDEQTDRRHSVPKARPIVRSAKNVLQRETRGIMLSSCFCLTMCLSVTRRYCQNGSTAHTWTSKRFAAADRPPSSAVNKAVDSGALLTAPATLNDR